MSGLPARASPGLRVETGPVGSPAAYLVDARVWNVVLLRLQNRAGQRSPFSSSLPRTPVVPPAPPTPAPRREEWMGLYSHLPISRWGAGGWPHEAGAGAGRAHRVLAGSSGTPLPGEKEAHCLPRRHTSGPVGLSAWEWLGGLVTQTTVPHPQSFRGCGSGWSPRIYMPTCPPADADTAGLRTTP